jgi:hypothetical protein
LSAERWQSYLMLQRKRAFIARNENPAADAAQRALLKQIHKDQRSKYKQRRDNEDG